MNKERIAKSQLLKHVPIDYINHHNNKSNGYDEEKITVFEREGNYFILEGLDEVMKTNGLGDIMVDCYVTHEDSFL